MTRRRTSRLLYLQVYLRLERGGLVVPWPIDRGIRAFAGWVALITLFVPLILSAQAAEPRSVNRPSAFLNSLSTYAQHAESPADDLKYATALIQMMTSHLSQNDTAQLARRVASADQAARHDSKRLVPETVIAKAFNQLMAQAGDSQATPFRTDALTVHRMRLVLAGNAPSLTSVKVNPDSCFPDEAVLLTVLLKINSGKVVVVPRDQAHSLGESGRIANAADDADMELDQYLAAHSSSRNSALFSRLLHDMGI